MISLGWVETWPNNILNKSLKERPISPKDKQVYCTSLHFYIPDVFILMYVKREVRHGLNFLGFTGQTWKLPGIKKIVFLNAAAFA